MPSNKTWLGTTDRYARQRAIEKLDPEADYLQITQMFYADFTSIMMPLPLAGFLTTFAAPRMSRILGSTGELEHRFAKRAVDTMLFAKLTTLHGFSPGPGRDAARRVNQMHKQYDIHPDDFILVGCDPLLYTIQVVERYGWRPITPNECEALRRFYSKEARAFGSHRPLPETFEEMQAFVSHYFDTELAFEPQNQRLAVTALDWYAALAPRPLRPLMRRVFVALMDPRVVRACGLPPSTPLSRLAAKGVMAVLSRRDPSPDDAPDLSEDLARLVYPDGWTPEMLGPCHHATKEPVGQQRALVESP